jgi:hypothetical protein
MLPPLIGARRVQLLRFSMPTDDDCEDGAPRAAPYTGEATKR